jgi:hypothetical protein
MVGLAAPAAVLPQRLLAMASLVGLGPSTSSTMAVQAVAVMQVQASQGLACSLVAVVLVQLQAARQQWCWRHARTKCCCRQMGQKVRTSADMLQNTLIVK